jgi:hypothetical protein
MCRLTGSIGLPSATGAHKSNSEVAEHDRRAIWHYSVQPHRKLTLKLQAWGNQKQLAVHDDDRNTPFTQADAARKLSVPRQRIYEAAAKLVSAASCGSKGKVCIP